MSLEATLIADLKTAMKAKDKAATRTIRAVKAAIILQKTDGSGTVLDAAGEIKLVQKLMKQRQESLDIYKKQNREDLAVVEEEEIAILQRYLPEPMSEEELTTIIKSIIEQTGAAGMKDMGKVMGIASQKVSGKADGKAISNVVKGLLS